MKTVSIAPNPLLISQRLEDGLTERNAAVFHRVMGVHSQIAITTQLQIHHRVFGKQRSTCDQRREFRLDR